MSQQVNLHNHSHFSFLDGLARCNEQVDRIKELGQEFMALTDHGECGGHMQAARLCAKEGIGFLPGMEGYWLPLEKVAWHKAQKERKDKYPHPSHITLLAANNTGLANIWRLSTEAYTAKYHYYKPIASPELLKEYSEGVYASDGCMMTEFASAILAGNEDIARQQLGTLLDIYRDRFFIELHTWQYIEADDHLRKFDDEMLSTREINARMTTVNQAKLKLATEMGIPVVVVNDSHHARPDQWENKELVWAMNTSNDNDKKFAESLEKAAPKADHMMGDDELYLYMRRHGISDDVVAEAIKNSYASASATKVDVLQPTMSMPRVGQSESDDLEMLIDACEEGFKRYVIDQGLDEGKYYQRMEEELTLITDKHFAGYFNVVRDCVMAFRSGSWAQYVHSGATKDPLLIGPGRGSVGGSLVAYLCGIDMIDPIKYGTSFSRFLSPGRKGLPDIDIDVPQSQRKDALAYLRKRDGDDNVCAIGTFSRNGVKGTLKDVGRALGIKLSELEPISEHIEQLEKLKNPDDPDEEDLTWDELLERKGGVLRPYQVRYPQLFSKMEEMTGLIRHSGVHASGVLISAEPILGRIPLRWTKGKNPVAATQFDMNDVEALGGVKFDWLGLRHLDTLSMARKLIYERHGVWIDYDRTGLSIPQGCTNVLPSPMTSLKTPTSGHRSDVVRPWASSRSRHRTVPRQPSPSSPPAIPTWPT
jgi:DNA polymerase-3 subunit alpha